MRKLIDYLIKLYEYREMDKEYGKYSTFKEINSKLLADKDFFGESSGLVHEVRREEGGSEDSSS